MAAAIAPLAVLALAPTAMARAAAAQPAAGLLPSVLPSVCVGGVLLCDNRVLTLPTPLPVPVPSVCVGPACTGDIIGTASPKASPAAPGTGNGGGGGGGVPTGPVTGGGTGAGVAVGTISAVALPAPPGVGLVPHPAVTSIQDSVNPDAYATVLSLSMRDGWGTGRSRLWPWLLAIQVLLWTLIAGIAWSRQLTPTDRDTPRQR